MYNGGKTRRPLRVVLNVVYERKSCASYIGSIRRAATRQERTRYQTSRRTREEAFRTLSKLVEIESSCQLLPDTNSKETNCVF